MAEDEIDTIDELAAGPAPSVSGSAKRRDRIRTWASTRRTAITRRLGPAAPFQRRRSRAASVSGVRL